MRIGSLPLFRLEQLPCMDCAPRKKQIVQESLNPLELSVRSVHF